MGLFDFVRDIGKKVFGADEEAAEKIKAEIDSANPGISNLDVQYEPQSGTVTLSGNAESAAAMQKAVLMAGNVEGVSQVEVAGLQHPPVASSLAKSFASPWSSRGLCSAFGTAV